MKRLSDITFDYFKGVREHIMEMRDTTTQPKPLKVEIPKLFFDHIVLNSLLKEYKPFKISKNIHKENWSINELLTMCSRGKDNET